MGLVEMRFGEGGLGVGVGEKSGSWVRWGRGGMCTYRRSGSRPSGGVRMDVASGMNRAYLLEERADLFARLLWCCRLAVPRDTTTLTTISIRRCPIFCAKGRVRHACGLIPAPRLFLRERQADHSLGRFFWSQVEAPIQRRCLGTWHMDRQFRPAEDGRELSDR